VHAPTRRPASTAFVPQRSGSPSAQPGCGVNPSWATLVVATARPPSSRAMALTAVAPASSPRARAGAGGACPPGSGRRQAARREARLALAIPVRTAPAGTVTIGPAVRAAALAQRVAAGGRLHALGHALLTRRLA